MNTTSATRRRLPFGRVVSTRTVWLVAGSWAPLVGLVMALGLQGGLTARWEWDVLTLLLIRLVVSYGAATKAFASRTRWGAMAWMASGAAIVVFLAPWQVERVYQHAPGGGRGSPWGGITACAAVAAAWYSLLTVLLHRPAGRSSHERADYGVALAALWVALSTLISNFALASFMPTYYLASRAEGTFAKTNVLVFGYHGWSSVSILDCQGLGIRMQGCHSGCFLLVVHLALAGLLPIAVALLVLMRIIARRRWVCLVEDGR